MFVAIVVTVCHLLAVTGSTPVCREEYVTDSDQTPGLTFLGCQAMGQVGIADWKGKSRYAGEQWFVQRYKCIPDRGYVIKDRI